MLFIIPPAKPQFLVAPQDVQAFGGEQVELSCEVTGLPRPQITWMHNTNEVGVGSDQDPEQLQTRTELLPSGSLLIRRAEPSDMGIYQCIARNEMGELRSQPVRLVVSNGNGVGNAREHIHPVANLIDPRSNQVWADAGASNANPNPSLSSNPVPSAPLFTHQPHDQVVALHGSGHVLLDCAASGWPQPDIQWFVNGRELAQSTANQQLQANGSLVLLQPTQLTAGTYRCEARNSLGMVQATARIEVKGE